MHAHISDVLMGGKNGSALEIIRSSEEHRRALGEMTVRLVLLALAYHANKDSHAWPSAKTLEKETGIDERKVRVALEVLQENSWIKKVAGYKPGKAGTKYLLTLPSFVDPEDSIEASSTHLVTHSPTQDLTQLSTHEVTRTSTQPRTLACDKEEVKYEYKNQEELLLFFESATDPFAAFWFCYPRKSSVRKNAQAKWKTAIPSVGVSAVVSALAQLLSAPLQNSDDYQPAHAWLADLVNKS